MVQRLLISFYLQCAALWLNGKARLQPWLFQYAALSHLRTEHIPVSVLYLPFRDSLQRTRRL